VVKGAELMGGSMGEWMGESEVVIAGEGETGSGIGK
jgi:hypothetical protein